MPPKPRTPKAHLKAAQKVARESKRELKRRAEAREHGQGERQGEGVDPAPAQHNKSQPVKRVSAREAALAKAKVVDEINQRKAAKERAKSAVIGQPLRIDLANPDDDVLEAEPDEESLPVEGARAVPGQRLARAERRVEALNMKIVGHDYRVIAQTLGVNVKTAYMDVQEALVYLAKHERVLAERVRELELARLDALQTMVWPAVERADTFAVQAYLKIMDHRARMLGLYAAEKVDIVDQRPLRALTDEELQQRTEHLLSVIKRKALPPAPAPGQTPVTAGGDGPVVEAVAVVGSSDSNGWSDTDPEVQQ